MEKKMEYITTKIEFTVNGIDKKFIVVHNVEFHGLSIQNLFYEWTFECRVSDVEKFCEYVMSRGYGIVCMSKKNINQLMKANYGSLAC